MKRVLFSIALALVLTRCGGDETVASKSAAAFREAQRQGKPLGPAEHGHGAVTPGQSTEVDHAAMGHGGSDTADHAAMGQTTGNQADHAAMGQGASGQMDHAAMGHGSGQTAQAAKGPTTSTADHAAMGHASAPQGQAAVSQGASTQDHAAMGHGAAAQDQASIARGAGTQDHAGMGHTTTSQDHAAMGHGTATPALTGAHAGHGGASGVIPAGGLWGPVPGALVNPVAPSGRETNAASTLQRDALDAAVPIAVAEANKAAGASPTMPTHEGHNQ